MEFSLDLLDLLLAQRPPFGGPSSRPPSGAAGAAAGAPLVFICCFYGVFFLALIVQVIGMWKVFDKAGKPGWAAIVPIYNMMVLAEIGGKDPMYGLLTLIPCVGIIFAIIIFIDVCNKFNLGAGFAIGLILLPYIFFPIMGFGSAQYGGRGGRRRRRPAYDEEEEEEERPRRRRRPVDEDDDY
jgi:hypothetical protein